MVERRVTRTSVGIVGGGPAGLMLSHLLALSGIDSVVVDIRSRREIEETVRAGILEADSVRLLVESGVSDRVLRDGIAHDGIDLRFGGVSHRVDFKELVGESAWLYPQTDVFLDLADARQRDGADVRFGVSDTKVVDVTGDSPGIAFTDADGVDCEVRCDFLVGADGSRSICRFEIPERERRHYFKEYPFAWFGILAAAPFSAPELIYAHSDRGFALISQRNSTLQRMYLQCDPDEDVGAWSQDRIWAELQARVSGEDGFALQEGRDHRQDRAALPQPGVRAHALRQHAARGRRRAHRATHRRQGPEPRPRGRPRARRDPRAGGTQGRSRRPR